MDEKDVTLYINCRNKYSAEAMYKFIECLLVVLNKKYKADEIFRTIEIMHSSDYIFYARLIDIEKDNLSFVNEKYFMSDEEVLKAIKEYSDDEKMFRYIFGNFIKGLTS